MVVRGNKHDAPSWTDNALCFSIKSFYAIVAQIGEQFFSSIVA